MREWKTIKEYEDILFDYYNGIAKITINSAPCPNPSSPWSTAMPSAAATSCTWYAT